MNFGDYEDDILQIITSFMNDQSIFFDIGAGIGWHTINVAKAFPKAKIYSFEPIQSLFDLLKGNLAMNNIENTECECLALGEANKNYNFHYLRNHNEYLGSIISEKTVECRMKKLDDIVEENNILKIDLIRHELKGDESSFIEGGLHSINKFIPLILISLHEYWNEEREEALFQKIDILTRLGYKCVIINNKNQSSKELKEEYFLLFHPNKHDIKSLFNSINKAVD